MEGHFQTSVEKNADVCKRLRTHLQTSVIRRLQVADVCHQTSAGPPQTSAARGPGRLETNGEPLGRPATARFFSVDSQRRTRQPERAAQNAPRGTRIGDRAEQNT